MEQMIQRPEREIEIIKQAIEAAGRATGFKLSWRRSETKKYDGQIKLTANRKTISFLAECKANVSVQTLGLILKQIQSIPGRAMLVADYINPSIANTLKQLEISFIDGAGNIFVRDQNLFIYVSGNKPFKETVIEIKGAFSPAELKVIFVLLCDEKIANTPLRNMSIKSNVTLGTAARVIRNLEKQNYLLQLPNKTRRIIRKKDLLDHWLLMYPTRLKPKLLIGKYRAADENWWKKTTIKGYWGGEVAAAKLTNHLKPAYQTIYTYHRGASLIVSNNLRSDPKGHVEILRAFWEETLNLNGCVPPLLTYVDLVTSGDPRNIETARIIYDQVLNRYFE